MPITMYMNNFGGLNLTDSPLSIQENQATGQSYNYEYSQSGAITKALASNMLNSTPDAQLKTLGIGIWHNADTDARSVIRVAGTKIQTYNTTTGLATNQTDDTATASTDFTSSSSTQPVVFAPFNTIVGGTVTWIAGGGMTNVEGYTGTNVTQNGTPAPTGAIVPVVNTHAGGTFTTPGTYYYAVQFRKLGTQVFSNLALDAAATVVNTDDTVTIPLTGITNTDTTRYDQIWIWRSAVNGASSFTVGSIIAKLASTATTYTDTGTSIVDSQPAARAGSTTLDNSTLTTQTYPYIQTFKRRLVVAANSTIYLSDLDKPESWPIFNTITIPTGGPITGISVIGVPSEYTTGADEYLCIFKERELWVLTGTSLSDWELKFVDKTGCASQSLAIAFNGFLTWIGYNGIFIWDGRGRPSKVSKLIHSLFDFDGDLDKVHLKQGYGAHYEKSNQVVWRVSHRTKGINQFTIKMNTKFTSLAAAQNLQNPEIEGVFITDTDSTPYYAVTSFRPSNFDEMLLLGDNAGNVYQAYNSATNSVSFDYETKALDMGAPQNNKRFLRVLAFIERLTTNDLTLYYWADYRIRTEYQSKVAVSMAPQKGVQPALYDIALWDQAFWDDYTPDISPIEFQLHSYENNAEGISLKLKFEQLEASAPVRIHGFAVEWQDLGAISIPTQQI